MIKIFLLAMIALATPHLVLAQTVDLRTALAEAINHRPFAKAAQAQAQEARQAARQAQGAYLPQLTLNENFVRTTQPGNGLFIALNQEDFSLSPTEDLYTRHDNFETRLTLRQSLLSSEIYYSAKEAKTSARAAQEMARWRAEEAAFAAFEAYLTVQSRLASVTSAQSAREEAAEVLRLARLHREAGTGLKTDELRAKVALSDAQRSLLTVRNDLSLARRRLGLTMGRGDAEIGIAEAVTPDIFDEKPAEQVLLRSDLSALNKHVQAAKTRRRKAVAAYLPTVNAEASYEMHDGQAPLGSEADHWSVQVGLSWTLFDGMQRESTRARASAQQQAAEQMHREAVDQALWSLKEAQLRAVEARAHWETTKEMVADATESHRLLQERYSAGLSDLSDLLAVRAVLDRARAEAVNAESLLIHSRGAILFQRGVFIQNLLSLKENAL